MANLGKLFTITGVANVTTFATDYLESTEAEKKHCDSIIVNVSAHKGNTVQVWLDREKLFEAYDYSLDTQEAAGGANPYKSATKLLQLPLDVDVPVGSQLKVAISCGGNATDVYGTFVYRV